MQATIANPDDILKPGMFATTTVVLPDKPAVITVPETAVDYTLYGDSVYLIKEKKEDDGKTSLTAERTFVRTGDRIDGRAVIEKGLQGRRQGRCRRPAQAAVGRRSRDFEGSAAADSGESAAKLISETGPPGPASIERLAVVFDPRSGHASNGAPAWHSRTSSSSGRCCRSSSAC